MVVGENTNNGGGNPVKAGVCKFPEEYHFSSALFYETGIDYFGFMTHYKD